MSGPGKLYVSLNNFRVIYLELAIVVGLYYYECSQRNNKYYQNILF